ncbi:MAG: NADH-quinone oxidoreductase subunit C [Candidatus Omnitrophica bacterium]|nr:NADH-quinone oxidoreductase subunit C [Candidatus Omnitrophota bacterium]
MENILQELKGRFAAKVLKAQERSARRVYFDFAAADIPAVVKFLFRDLKCRFVIATGMDTPEALEIIYHFSHDASGKMISLRAFIPDKKNPEIDSITPIIIGAEWIEREIWELLGINFKGHPNLKRLLLADEWPEGKYPLRKSS